MTPHDDHRDADLDRRFADMKLELTWKVTELIEWSIVLWIMGVAFVGLIVAAAK